MQAHPINFKNTGMFSPLFLDYINQEEKLRPFYTHTPHLDSFEPLMNQYENQVDRGVLVESLFNQYSCLNFDDNISASIQLLLHENTFTVTTGHQLNLFSGPVFFIYKIVTTINLAKKLRVKYPTKNFVPMYWMATEDHDFAEINHFNLFGKKYTWESEQKGAVGKFQLDEIAKSIEDLPEKIALFEKAYNKHKNLADATRYFVNELFKSEGLLIIDGDDFELKKLLIPTLKKEITEEFSFSEITKTNDQLAKVGYNAQVNPREINLFYMKENVRERIVKIENSYQVLNTDLQFSQEEILKEIEDNPHFFSPNVVLRPVYQQIILPNLAYIGGPGELAYWVQLKNLFENNDTPFPVFIPRNFALYINKVNSKKVNKLGLKYEELFLEKNLLVQHYLYTNVENEISLNEESQELQQLFEKIMIKVKAVDASLGGFVGGEEKKILKDFKNIEKRLKKTEEKKQETELKQVENLKDKLFPNNNLQERVENYLNFAINHPEFIDELFQLFDPFDFRFNTLIHE